MNKNKVKIMATEYDLEEVEQIDKYQRLLGQIDYVEQTIKIDKNISEDMKKEVLLHEILHGILEKLGFEGINSDEQKVHSIASTMYLVLKENNFISLDSGKSNKEISLFLGNDKEGSLEKANKGDILSRITEILEEKKVTDIKIIYENNQH